MGRRRRVDEDEGWVDGDGSVKWDGSVRIRDGSSEWDGSVRMRDGSAEYPLLARLGLRMSDERSSFSLSLGVSSKNVI